MTDNKEKRQSEGEGKTSSHLDEALEGFRKGLSSLGLFCTEEMLPLAEKATREGLDGIQDLLKKANAAMDEAFRKAREEFTSQEADEKDDNQKPDPK